MVIDSTTQVCYGEDPIVSKRPNAFILIGFHLELTDFHEQVVKDELFLYKKNFSGKMKPKKKDDQRRLLNIVKVGNTKKNARESFACGACGHIEIMEEDDEEQLPRENMVGSYHEEDHLRREEQEKVAELRRFEEAIK
ncbi:hypothetical protein Tco_0724230 [Tanacetum coccineum]